MNKLIPSPAPDAPLPARLWTGVRAFRRLMRDVTDPYYGPLFQESLDGAKYARIARGLRRNANGNRLLDDRPSLAAGDVDLARLEALPPGSLGHEYSRFYTQPGVDPLHSLSRNLSDSQYLAKRMRETHDLHHLLTGYGTDMVGEHELQAFQYGNLRTPTSLLTLVATFFRRYPIARRDYLRRLRRAYRRGRASLPIANIPWEDHWEAPLQELHGLYLRDVIGV